MFQNPDVFFKKWIILFIQGVIKYYLKYIKPLRIWDNVNIKKEYKYNF